MDDEQQYVEVEVPVEPATLKATRPPGVLVVLGIIAITGASVAGLCYSIILDGDATALQSLSNLALIGVGALASMVGASNGKG